MSQRSFDVLMIWCANLKGAAQIKRRKRMEENSLEEAAVNECRALEWEWEMFRGWNKQKEMKIWECWRGSKRKRRWKWRDSVSRNSLWLEKKDQVSWGSHLPKASNNHPRKRQTRSCRSTLIERKEDLNQWRTNGSEELPMWLLFECEATRKGEKRTTSSI